MTLYSIRWWGFNSGKVIYELLPLNDKQLSEKDGLWIGLKGKNKMKEKLIKNE